MFIFIVYVNTVSTGGCFIYLRIGYHHYAAKTAPSAKESVTSPTTSSSAARTFLRFLFFPPPLRDSRRMVLRLRVRRPLDLEVALRLRLVRVRPATRRVFLVLVRFLRLPPSICASPPEDTPFFFLIHAKNDS